MLNCLGRHRAAELRCRQPVTVQHKCSHDTCRSRHSHRLKSQANAVHQALQIKSNQIDIITWAISLFTFCDMRLKGLNAERNAGKRPCSVLLSQFYMCCISSKPGMVGPLRHVAPLRYRKHARSLSTCMSLAIHLCTLAGSYNAGCKMLSAQGKGLECPACQAYQSCQVCQPAGTSFMHGSHWTRFCS